MRNAKTCWLVLLALSVSLLGASVAMAQRIDGDLRGTVKDPSGAVVPAAKVIVTNQNTGVSRSLETTEAGIWIAANLLPGPYTVQIEATGFKKAVRRNVEVVANRVAEVNVDLEIGEASQTVIVESGAALVETQTVTLAGGTFTGDLLYSGVASMGGSQSGDVRNLAILAPGTTTQPGGMAGQGGSIGGNRPRNNNFVVDGLDNNDPSVTGANGPVINEAVKEFTLLTNQFTAEFGHSTAGQFIITTETGGNQIHGKGWWYNQNRHFNSLDNLTRSTLTPGADKPRFDLNRLGGQVGGPVMKDKWFYFGSYELQNVGLAGTAANVIRVPTAQGLQTLQSLAGMAGSGISPVNVGILTDFVPTAGSQTFQQNVCNELTNPTCDPAGALVSIPLGDFQATTPQFLKTHLFLISQDVSLGAHKLAGRYHYSRQRSITAGALPIAIFNSDTVFDTQRVTLSDVWTPTSRMVNELRVGYMRRIGPDQVVQNIPAPGNNDMFGNYAITELGLNIGPLSNFPQGQSGNTYQFADNLAYVRGRHTIKAGVDVRNVLRTGGFLPRARGDFAWTNDPTGNTVGSRNVSGLDGFVRDVFPTNVSIRGVGSGTFTQNRMAWYTFIQDTWKIHPRVVLDAGVRFEFTEPARDSALQDLNGLANITSIQNEPFTEALLRRRALCDDDPVTALPDCIGNPLIGVSIFSTLTPRHQQELLGQVGDRLIFRAPRSDRNNWAPRLGLAWDVRGNGKTSVRAGFARGFDVLFGNLALLQLPPQIQAENRETNACFLAPSPAYCANAAGGLPRANGSDIRFNTVGFIEGGALLPALPTTTSTDPYAARAATGNFVEDEIVPETYTWTLAVQHELNAWGQWLLEARYLGTRGLHLPTQRWLNVGVPAYFEGVQLPMYVSMAEVPTSFTASDLTLAQFQAQAIPTILAPYGFNGVLTKFSADGKSIYHGGSFKAERRFANGLFFTTSYTWSKTIDTVENELFTSSINPRRPFNLNDINHFRGLSGIHRAHKVTMAWVYQFPKYSGGNALVRGITNGWQWGGAYVFETGQPITIQARRDVDGNGDTAGDFAFHNPNGTSGVGADSRTVCWNGAAVSFGCNTAAQIVGYVSLVDNAEWIRPGLGGVATGGRGTHIAGQINNWNMEFSKRTPFWGEGRYIEFSAQFINMFNHPSFSIGSGSILGLQGPAQNNTGYVTPGNASFLKDDTFSGGLGQQPFQRVVQWTLKVIF